MLKAASRLAIDTFYKRTDRIRGFSHILLHQNSPTEISPGQVGSGGFLDPESKLIQDSLKNFPVILAPEWEVHMPTTLHSE